MTTNKYFYYQCPYCTEQKDFANLEASTKALAKHLVDKHTNDMVAELVKTKAYLHTFSKLNENNSTKWKGNKP